MYRYQVLIGVTVQLLDAYTAPAPEAPLVTCRWISPPPAKSLAVLIPFFFCLNRQDQV